MLLSLNEWLCLWFEWITIKRHFPFSSYYCNNKVIQCYPPSSRPECDISVAMDNFRWKSCTASWSCGGFFFPLSISYVHPTCVLFFNFRFFFSVSVDFLHQEFYNTDWMGIVLVSSLIHFFKFFQCAGAAAWKSLLSQLDLVLNINLSQHSEKKKSIMSCDAEIW